MGKADVGDVTQNRAFILARFCDQKNLEGKKMIKSMKNNECTFIISKILYYVNTFDYIFDYILYVVLCRFL